jgi:hypothetical protein
MSFLDNKRNIGRSYLTSRVFALVMVFSVCICPPGQPPQDSTSQPDSTTTSTSQTNQPPPSITDTNFSKNLLNNETYKIRYKDYKKIYEVYKMGQGDVTFEYEVFEKKINSRFFEIY